MVLNDVLILCKENINKDGLGVESVVLDEKEVYCTVSDITQKEFSAAGTQGLKPRYKFNIANFADYDGEEIVKYRGELYSVYRTFRANNESIDIYVEAKKGVS